MTERIINIGVTGLNAIDSPGPGVPVIRGLREATSFKTRIIGLAYEPLEPGIYLDALVDKTYLIPYPSAGTDMLLARLEHIQSIEKLDVIIPNFDAELYSFIKLEPALKKIGISMFLPTMEQFEERHKVNLNTFGEKHNMDVPESKAVINLVDVVKTAKEMGFPVMVKGKYYDAYVAATTDQARNYFEKVSAKWGLPVILQKFVKGTELNMTGLGDGNGNTIAAVGMRKQFITDKGKAWAGITIHDYRLMELTRHFITTTKWRGGFELEIMKSSDNTYYLMEINPRIPAWIYLAIGVGQNIPEALVNLALGRKVEPYETYEAGKLFIRYSYDMIVSRERFEELSVNGELENDIEKP
ncbi:MAG TPA: ATP-grasp domain-containing protein [Bacteroidales bacterium]|nr:ATP-grasp domain-containing protein [Bacteroidales bacterium]HPT01024.1 ATP-grasp domain-containing protein [Bacteroidales bacterium]